MKSQENILKEINSNKELKRNINNNFYGQSEEERQTAFIDNAKRYIKAIKEGRVICNIASVSKSGMSRNIKFLECSGRKSNYHYSSFYSLFKSLGYASKDDNFRINGCGMDMIFHTNYTNIHNFKSLGLISAKQCSVLAQRTPSII